MNPSKERGHVSFNTFLHSFVMEIRNVMLTKSVIEPKGENTVICKQIKCMFLSWKSHTDFFQGQSDYLMKRKPKNERLPAMSKNGKWAAALWCTPVESDKQTVKWHITGEPRSDKDHKWKDPLKFIYEYRWSQCKESWRVAIFSTLVFGEHLFEHSFQTGFPSRVRCRFELPTRPSSTPPPTTSIDHSISTEQSTSTTWAHAVNQSQELRLYVCEL